MSKAIISIMDHLVILCLFFGAVQSTTIDIPPPGPLLSLATSEKLPVKLSCDSPNDKFIEVRGVTFEKNFTAILANTLYPNIDKSAEEECVQSLVTTQSGAASCKVDLKPASLTKGMIAGITYTCLPAMSHESHGKIYKVSKKSGTIQLDCKNKEALVEIIDAKREDNSYVDVDKLAEHCYQEDLQSMAHGKGGKCNVKLEDKANSMMTITFRCLIPPQRDFTKFEKKEKKVVPYTKKMNKKEKSGSAGIGNDKTK